MTYSFGKLFSSLYTGSMVGAGPTRFAVWTYCIANAQPPGEIELNPKLLATILGTDEDDVVDAIDFLCSEDLSSRSADELGRRLVPTKTNFLYSMPTWPKYQQIRNAEARRESNRLSAQRAREKKRQQ